MKAMTRRFLCLHIVNSSLRISYTIILNHEVITRISEILAKSAPANNEILKNDFFIISPFQIRYFSNVDLGSKTNHENVGFIS